MFPHTQYIPPLPQLEESKACCKALEVLEEMQVLVQEDKAKERRKERREGKVRGSLTDAEIILTQYIVRQHNTACRARSTWLFHNIQELEHDFSDLARRCELKSVL